MEKPTLSDRLSIPQMANRCGAKKSEDLPCDKELIEGFWSSCRGGGQQKIGVYDGN
jgi:hypothetical protein